MKWKPISELQSEKEKCRAWVREGLSSSPYILWLERGSNNTYLTDHSGQNFAPHVTHYCPIPKPEEA